MTQQLYSHPIKPFGKTIPQVFSKTATETDIYIQSPDKLIGLERVWMDEEREAEVFTTGALEKKETRPSLT